MKKIILLLLIVVMASPSLKAQKRISISKIPQIVITNFTAKFSSVQKVKWRTKEALYFASFMQSDKGIDVIYQSTGDWVETMYEIDIKDLPDAVVKGASNLYKDSKIKAASKIEESTRNTLYMLQLKFHGKNVEMTLDEKGTQIS